jgi:hypothetical protein
LIKGHPAPAKNSQKETKASTKDSPEALTHLSQVHARFWDCEV